MWSKDWLTTIACLYISSTVNAAESTLVINDVSWAPYFFIEDNSQRLGIAKQYWNPSNMGSLLSNIQFG